MSKIVILNNNSESIKYLSKKDSNLNILFQRYASKWLFLELLKENFSSWDRYLLFCLFMNKKFRNT